ncbi:MULTISPECIES: 4Fe-4S dicluster domain-containing protein [Flexistipes]|uniref:4Fe-4S ferredoxin iron-sulfur binding domain-containing protein n=1 Tax=Flexistipes sinusarabici (strain ATCC 49648 / DSM 4947 / MAS 10) TaxID=717231 RepID=F8E8N8_FLESM|nr:MULTISPECIES: 4Fe-4S dicluster domain-containing protein [Flexistipes]AEI15161.1 4Fe-4S ferredoxin iron-sulfur binding domain-containing protein [Flexistipes sinusarabici DSM 4947]MEC9492345.1 4Fe-4S dicluster domain-containing protein [Flexistipes sp.]
MAKKKYAIVLDASKCLNCKACTVACKFENNVPVGQETYRIWVTENRVHGNFPDLTQTFQPSQCQHCENTPCASVCPTNATYKTEEGVVLVDYDKCVLCKACMTACPYDARFVDEHLEVVEKCTMCYHRLPDRDPACVETCPTKVRVFGDINDPKSKASKLLAKNSYYRLKPSVNTRPRLFYVD